MARIRTIKPEFWKNETLGEMGSDAQLLFIGLWNLCDRRGFVEFRPKRIKAELFPYRDFDVYEILKSLNNADFIRIITHGEKQFIHVINFNKHQVINIKEPESTIPKEFWHSASTVPAQCQHSTDTQGKEGKGKEGNGYILSETKILLSDVLDVTKAIEPTLLTDDQKETRLKAVQSELFAASKWHEDVAIALQKKPIEVKNLLQEFIKVLRADSEYFKPLKQIQAHFRNWAKRQNNGTAQPKYELNANVPML